MRVDDAVRNGGPMVIRDMVAAERADFVEFLRSLSDEDWEKPSLCDGWRVRDVVAHVSIDAVPLGQYVRASMRNPSADKLNQYFVDSMARLSPTQLADSLESTIGRGWFQRTLPSIALSDGLVHQQDIRRPLGRQRSVPEERLLHALNHPDPFAWPRRYTKGLRLVATDVDWSKGAGPEVRGKGEALVLAMVGRPVVLDELEGDGVPALAARMRRV